jgi:hypothetical protein
MQDVPGGERRQGTGDRDRRSHLAARPRAELARDESSDHGGHPGQQRRHDPDRGEAVAEQLHLHPGQQRDQRRLVHVPPVEITRGDPEIEFVDVVARPAGKPQ